MTLLTDDSVPATHLAREVEARGFSSLFFAEHTHIPSSRRDPWPGGPQLPDDYRRLLDPLLSLTAAATSTERIRLGTGVCLVAQHDPIVLAKQVATLDVISAGRVTLGIGIGWNTEEAANHGLDPKRRRAVLRENVLAMTQLWTMEEAEFGGEHVSFSPSWAWPKPVQTPHPPLILGGAGGPITWKHVIEYCDGWMPIVGTTDIAAKRVELHAAAEAAGRDPTSLHIGAYGGRGDPASLAQYADAGVDEVLLPIPSQGERAFDVLDRHAKAVEQWSAG